MPEQSKQFNHIPLKLTKSGTAFSDPRRRPRPSARSVANGGNRGGHGGQLKSSVSSIVSNWQNTLEKRRNEGLPDIPEIPSFLLQVDPQSFDADTLKSFGIEVILELEDGYILGASADAELTKLQEKVEKFLAKEHGGGTVAQIWEIIEGNLKRLEYILSPDLLAEWDQILEEHSYIVDVSIACVGLNLKFPEYPYRGENEDPIKYARRLALWSNKRDQTLEEWQNLQFNRECDFENFVRKLGGTFLYLGDYQDGLHPALLPDSFSGRIEISGRGLRDLVTNYPYVFEVSEPDQIAEPLTNRTTVTTDQPSFTLDPPSPLAPKVCIIDSGIQESHRLLRVAVDSINSLSWVPGETNIKADHVPGGGHGTRVAGAVLYPQGIPRTGRQTAVCWLQNARVLDRDRKLPDKLYISEVLNDIVGFYHPIGTRIFNHSITSSAPCRRTYMSAWAAEIDYLSWQNDILFIVSAGNLSIDRGLGLSITRKTLKEHFQGGCVYPDFLLKDSSRIANPAQSFQALTVGSIAHCTYNQPPITSVASQDYPSAFSCTGYGIWDSIKPEVVEYGGDFVKDGGNPPSFSNAVTDVCPELVRTTMGGAPAVAADNIGTSFSAPKVAHIAAALAANFPQESCLLYRALIVQSARLPLWTNNEPDLSSAIRMMGYGLPNLERAMGNAPNRVTLITSGDSRIQARQAQIYQVMIPEELQSPAKASDILVEITLSYKAEPRRTRRNKRKYLSTWLHWECSERGESPDSFLAKILEKSEVSENAEESSPGVDNDGEGIFAWTIGRQKNHSKRVKDTSRGVGTIQKDWAVVKSFDLREAFCIAVVAHKGWNNEPQIPYSLVVSFEALNSIVPIYEPFVKAQISLQAQQQVQVGV